MSVPLVAGNGGFRTAQEYDTVYGTLGGGKAIDPHSNRARQEGISRNEAKARNFAQAYGMSGANLAELLTSDDNETLKNTVKGLMKLSKRVVCMLAARADLKEHKIRKHLQEREFETRKQLQEMTKHQMEDINKRKEDSKIELAKALSQAIGAIAQIVGEGGLAR